MAKKSRAPRLEKSCPLPSTHTRLHQIHDQWHRVAADYADPDGFVTSLNAALVALRSVTFLLQKEKSRIPDFESFYASQQARLAADPLMVWLRDARNHVEKQGDLDIHSQARVRLLGPAAEQFSVDLDVDPLLTQQEIASRIAADAPPQARRQGLLAVERRWVAREQPEHELLDLLAYGYGVVAAVVAAAHRQCGVIMQIFGDESHEDRPARREYLAGRLSCMVAHASLRTAYVHLAKQQLVEWGTRTRELTRDDLGDMELPPLPADAFERVEGEPLLDSAERWAEVAKAFCAAADGHEPTAMLFASADAAPSLNPLYARDVPEQSLMMQALADRVTREGAQGVLFIAELRDEEGQGRLVVAMVTADGGRRQWITPLLAQEFGPRKLGETKRTDGAAPDLLHPILAAWVAAGRGPSEQRLD
jgi:hypothetical protein